MKELHRRLKSAFKIEDDILLRDELKAMITEFGESRTEKAVTNFLRNEQYFSIAKLREYVPAVEAKGHLYDPNCPDCMEGWREMKWEEIDSKVRNRMVELYGFAQAQKETLVKRCHCWKVPA